MFYYLKNKKEQIGSLNFEIGQKFLNRMYLATLVSQKSAAVSPGARWKNLHPPLDFMGPGGKCSESPIFSENQMFPEINSSALSQN